VVIADFKSLPEAIASARAAGRNIQNQPAAMEEIHQDDNPEQLSLF